MIRYGHAVTAFVNVGGQLQVHSLRNEVEIIREVAGSEVDNVTGELGRRVHVAGHPHRFVECRGMIGKKHLVVPK